MFNRWYLSLISLLLLGGCGHQKEEKKTYFKKNEYKQSKTFRLAHHMSFDELKEEKTRLRKQGFDYLAITFLKEMIKKCENPDELRELRLEYADILYGLQRFAEATEEYELYVQLYPGSSSAAYADYRAILSKNGEVLGADRDQGATQKVVDLAKEYGKKALHRNEYKKYFKEVEELAHAALYRLYESEILRFYFYINRKQCKAALKRLEYIKEHYLKYLPEIESTILELDYELCCELDHHDEATDKKCSLLKRFPQYKMDKSRRREYARII